MCFKRGSTSLRLLLRNGLSRFIILILEESHLKDREAIWGGGSHRDVESISTKQERPVEVTLPHHFIRWFPVEPASLDYEELNGLIASLQLKEYSCVLKARKTFQANVQGGDFVCVCVCV